MLIEEKLEDKLVLDVGCGSGRLTFALATYAKKVVGIDISEASIEKAKSIAGEKRTENVEFQVADAEAIEYNEFLGGDIDVVTANLCMSSEIIIKSSKALKKGGPFAFVCFQSDQLKEIGGSGFSFDEDEMRRLLETSGFIVEHFDVEKWTLDLPEKEIIEKEYRNYPWAVRRWDKLMSYFEKGGRTLSQGRLLVKARKM